MDENQKELKQFLEQQLQWTKEQMMLLNAIDEKLHEMRAIAQYVVDQKNLSSDVVNKCNEKINELKQEVHILEKQLRGIVH